MSLEIPAAPVPLGSSTDQLAAGVARSRTVIQRIRRELQEWDREGRGEKRVEEYERMLVESNATDDDWYDLILTEITSKRRRGRHPTLDEYARRFPKFTGRLIQFFDGQTTQAFHSNGASEVGATGWPIQVPGYEILSELGRGGMGVVFKARQVGLNRLVALKMVLSGRLASSQDLQRFVKEAEAVAAVNHPNIVQVHEIGEHEGRPYFSLEFVEGGNLAERLKSGPLDPRGCAEAVEAVARAAQAAHEHGIVHRDLKPANILLQPNVQRSTGRSTSSHGALSESAGAAGTGTRSRTVRNATLEWTPKITDFGIAKRLDDQSHLTSTGIAAGTPQYMAPEQALAKRSVLVGPSADIYSIGVILFEMLTGRPPFDGANAVDVMKQVVNREAPPPSRFNPKIPKDLETITLKCLQKEPKRRYETAGELADDLQRWLDGRPILARPVGTIGRARSWCRRNPFAAVSILAVALMLVSATAVSTTLAIRAERSSADAKRIMKLLAEEKAIADRNKELAEERERIARADRERAEQSERSARQAADTAQAAEEDARSAHHRAMREQSLRSRELYAGSMNLAFSSYLAGQSGLTRIQLRKHRPVESAFDFRGFEWHFLNELCNSPVHQFDFGASNRPVSHFQSTAPIAANDRWLVADANTIHLWNPGRNLMERSYTVPGEQGLVRSIATATSSNKVALLVGDDRLHFWDWTDGRGAGAKKVPLDGKAGESLTDLALSPDGTIWIAGTKFRNFATSGSVLIGETADGEPKRMFRSSAAGIMSVAVDKDGTLVAGATYLGEVIVFNRKTEKEVCRFKPAGEVNRLVFSPRDDLLAVGTGDGKVHLVRSQNGTTVRLLTGMSDWVNQLQFDRDGRRIACSSPVTDVIRLYDVSTGELLRELNGHWGEIGGLSFSQDGHSLCSMAYDGLGMVWNLQQDPLARTMMGRDRGTRRIHCLPDGRRAVLSSNQYVVQILDTESGKVLHSVQTPTPGQPVTRTAVSGDGGTVAVLLGQSLQLYRLTPTGIVPIPTKPIADRSNDVILSADGRIAVTAHQDGSIRRHVIDEVVESKTIVQVKRSINRIAWVAGSAVPEVAAASEDGTIRIYTQQGDEVMVTLSGNHRPTDLTASPDGSLLATAGEDGSARIWSRTGKILHRLTGHHRNVQSVRFDPTGIRLLTSCSDGCVRIWDPVCGACTLCIQAHGRGVFDADFSSDGGSVLSTSGFELREWSGRRSLHAERVNTLARLLQVDDVRSELSATQQLTVTVRFRNPTASTLQVPNRSFENSQVRIQIQVERMASDGSIPALGGPPNEVGRYHVGVTQFLPRTAVPPGGQFEIQFPVNVKGYPTGRFRLELALIALRGTFHYKTGAHHFFEVRVGKDD